ncbi:MAG: Holliday junction branch migration DNA helicase RuvB [Candidatus Muirbacterium halophilum]|nr:Holliday junction branch migration DNA helicase RuvB [Candidatus Muirbacterium halophilum]MCK9475053.1 Holliday junction branch migration DNA helicase RuvB [Candidatus Muirbacterium halophilum]
MIEESFKGKKKDENRIVSPQKVTEIDHEGDLNLRPQKLCQFIGQKSNKEKLSLVIQGAKNRGDAPDHILFSGPPGLGKTTLASIIAGELESTIKITSGPTLTKTGDIAKLLTDLQENDVLFIDEIHRLNRSVEEVLYSAMEDFKLDILIGKANTAKSMRLPLKKFTLVGATTMSGLLSSPLRDRFGIHIRLDYYKKEALKQIILRYSDLLGIKINNDAAEKLANCGRGTPRITLRILRRVRDYAETSGNDIVDVKAVEKTLEILEIDNNGLDYMDRKIMNTIIEKYNSGPVSLDTIAMSIGEESRSIYEVYEPYLLQLGFLSRTPRGRTATDAAKRYFSK